jgi:hypothetical protein
MGYEIQYFKGPVREEEPMRYLPDADQFSSNLIEDMHKAFDAVCADRRLSAKSDKATKLVATKVVELAKAGRKGDDLKEAALKYFAGT